MNHLDQVEALNALTNMAAIIRHYYDELIEQGFTPEQALELCIAFQDRSQRGTE